MSETYRIFRSGVYPAIFAILIILSGSCEKNVDIDIGETDAMIVVNGVLMADSTVRIYLSRTRHILDNNEINSLTNATVELSDAEGNTEQLLLGDGQLYRSDQMNIEPGKEYTIRASVPGYNDVEASTVIPVNVPIASFDTSRVYDDYGETMVEFEIILDDPPGVDNYYMISIKSHLQYFNTEYLYYLDTLYVDQEKDTVVVGYVRDSVVYKDVRNESIWFESENLAIEQEDSYSSRVIFSDRLFDGKTYTIRGRFNTWFLYGVNDSSTIDVSLQTIDSHYYKYIDSRTDHYYARNDPFAVPVVVHNNIQNGVGILGAMSSDQVSFKLAPVVPDWEREYLYK
ncbi:MAG: DUF4249 domain-containing protein [Bacteroidales bacterium]